MSEKVRSLLFKIGAVVILVAIAVTMLFVGRGHTVYFDNKAIEINGEKIKGPYKVEVFVNGERVAKLYDKERGKATWIGQNFKMTLEITQEKGGDPVTKGYEMSLPHDWDGIIINLPGLLNKAPYDVFMTQYVQEEVVEEDEGDTGEVETDEFAIGDF